MSGEVLNCSTGASLSEARLVTWNNCQSLTGRKSGTSLKLTAQVRVLRGECNSY